MNVVERCQIDLEELGSPHAASVLESRLDAAAKKEAPLRLFPGGSTADRGGGAR